MEIENVEKSIRRESIKKKIVKTLVVSITFILFVTFIAYFYLFNQELNERYQEELTSLASTTAQLIDSNEHNKLRSRDDERSSEYLRIKSLLKEFKKANPDVIYIYTMRRTTQENLWEFVVDAEDENPSHIGDFYDVSQQEEMKKAFNGPITDRKFEQDQWGTFLSGYAPIRDEMGNAIAIVGIDMRAQAIKDHQIRLIVGALTVFVFSLGIVHSTTNKLANYFLLPLKDIIRGIREIQGGNTSFKLSINTNDEFEDIGEMLNIDSDLRREYQEVIEKNLQREKKQKNQLLKVYSDVISAVTQGKLTLVNPLEVVSFAKEGDLWGKLLLEKPVDVNQARELVGQVLEQKQSSVRNLMLLKLCVSEAATNALKHAGSGEVEIRKVKDFCRIIISDNGPGMEYDKLPHMIFLQGFSTKISLGVGFSLIYKYADKIYLLTSDNGTLLMLDFQLESIGSENIAT